VAAQIRASIADGEFQFIITRQVADLLRANPGVSSAFLFLLKRGKSVLMSSEKWKPCGAGVVTCNAVDE